MSDTWAAERAVQAPPDEAFAAICDPSSWERWLPMHGGWPDGIPAHSGEGASFRQQLGVFGVTDTVTVTVTEQRAPEVFAIRAEGNHGADLDLAFHVEPDGAGSVVRMEAQIVGKLVRPLRILAGRGLDATVKQTLRQLEEYTR